MDSDLTGQAKQTLLANGVDARSADELIHAAQLAGAQLAEIGERPATPASLYVERAAEAGAVIELGGVEVMRTGEQEVALILTGETEDDELATLWVTPQTAAKLRAALELVADPAASDPDSVQLLER